MKKRMIKFTNDQGEICIWEYNVIDNYICIDGIGEFRNKDEIFVYLEDNDMTNIEIN